MSTFPPFKYSQLDSAKQEIRLINLLPSSNFDDPVRLIISHSPFFVQEKEPKSRHNLRELRKAFEHGRRGDGMVMHETIEGRILIGYWEKGWKGRWSTWETGCGPKATTEDFELQDGMGFEPKFEALSYTWGSNADRDTLFVLDEEQNDGYYAGQNPGPRWQLDVTQNLAIALKHLRYDDRTRRMWIDAICINQHNVTERNEQVRRMKNIYKVAHRVVAWLGPSSSGSGFALSTLEHIGRQVEYTTEDTTPPGPDATEYNWYQKHCLLPYGEEHWQSIYDLITRPWFDRIWVVQEIQLANSRAVVQCGTDQISWYLLRRGIRCLVNRARGVPKYLNDRLLLVSTMCEHMIGKSLPQLLMTNTSRKCVDPLDKIYGILGLAPTNAASSIVPDYASSTLEGYKTTFLNYTSLSRRLHLLDQCNPGPRVDDRPSWVPDWSRDSDEIDYLQLGVYPSGDSAAHWSYSEPNILEVTGVQFKKVIHVWQCELRSDNDFSGLVSEVGFEMLQNSQYPTGDSLLDAHAYVLYRGRLGHLYWQTGSGCWIPSARAKRTILHGSPNELQDFTRAHDLKWLLGRKLVQTEGGYIGLAPGHVQIGDIICVILGSNVPTVLRKNSDGTFKIVGHSYLHGVMNGEALLGPLPKPWAPKREFNPTNQLWEQRFFDTEKREAVDAKNDPRLEPVPDQWECLENDAPFLLQKWKNKETGEIINSDPRLLPQALIERGVKLQTFALS
ncbi:uncharacterized protein PAC_08459 [Phialocephala subalpina]|uniref:Heterokaryon incompatibility domain-containing protein n=1 Tax=Phialocephala subalpina TaxID=576137 RepID=A0A1L7X0N8_9HELO|nr:uncharacterized protein PAC_08459 [Phialocephala subalpina]